MIIKNELKYLSNRINWLQEIVFSKNNKNNSQTIAQQINDLKIIKREFEELKDDATFVTKNNRWSIVDQIEQLNIEINEFEDRINKIKQPSNKKENDIIVLDAERENTWELGRKIKYFNGSLYKNRKKLNLTGEDVANYLGISTSAYYSYESMRSIPSEDIIKRIEKLFGISKEQLFPIELLKLLRNVEKKEISYSKAEVLTLNDNNDRDNEIDKIESNNDPINHALLEERAIEIESALNTLTDREKVIISLYYGFNGERPHRLTEIANMYDVTEKRMRQILNRSLSKLRKTKNIRELHDYVEIEDNQD